MLFYVILIPFSDSVHHATTIRCDPFESHKRQVFKDLRTVSKEMIDSGFVKVNQQLCSNCRKTFFEKIKTKEPPTNEPEDDWTDVSSNAESISEESSDTNEVQETRREMIIPAMNSVLSVVGESPIKTGE